MNCLFKEVLNIYPHKLWYEQWTPNLPCIVITMNHNRLHPSLIKMKTDIFRAFDGKKLNDTQISLLAGHRSLYVINNNREVSRDHSSKGSIGCSLSHILVWNKLLQLKRKAIILEDDAIIKDSSKLMQLYNDTHEGFISIGFFGSGLFNNYGGGTRGYIICPDIAQILFNYSLPCTTHIDKYIKEIRQMQINNKNLKFIQQKSFIGDTGRKSTIVHPSTKYDNLLFINRVLVVLLIIIFILLIIKCFIKIK